MWPFTKRSTRRKEIARSKAERQGIWYRRFPDQQTALVILSTVAAAILAAVILNFGGPAFRWRENQTVSRAVTSRVKFEVVDEQRTLQERLRARDRSPNYYKLDVSLLDDLRGRLLGAFTMAKAHTGETQELVRAAAENNILLDESGWTELLRLAAQDNIGAYERAVDAVLARLKTSLLVEPEPAGTRRTPIEAVLLDPTIPREIRRPMAELRYSNDESAVQRIVEEAVRGVPSNLQPSFNNSLLAMLRRSDDQRLFRSIYLFDTNRSVEMAEAAQNAVAPVIHVYSVGDRLADTGLLDPAEMALLRIEHRAYLASEETEQSTFYQNLGRTLLVFLVVIGTAAYMRRYQRGVFTNHFRRVVSSIVLLLILALTRMTYLWTDIPPHFAVGLQAFAAGLLAVVYRDEAVFAISCSLAILMAMSVQESIPFFFILLAASGAMVFGLHVVRYRGKIVLAGAGAALTAGAAALGVGLLEGQHWRFVLNDCLWTAGTVQMAAFVIEGILPAVERVFRLSTGMTLLEWCDASKPLLRLLAAEAPGTYNHCLMVGSLAEAAADAIGADGLRCRAGAYYHDIGKINKPEYFVENQTPGMSRHNKLSPAMSLLVIIGHVKDGIEMAKEYGLPATLHPFIPEHHGTTLVQYFYHAANQARAPDDPEIADSEYRYPGPKPQSKETAILMLCDGVEGAVRAMSEPTPNRIEAVVSDIVHKRLMDGQLDECDLTFKELSAIEKSLVKNLCGIYHARIAYPEKEEDKKSAAS